MQLGWIDFSKNERNKVLSVIHQLEEPAAVDELGLGAIRDGFADYFFPGTSTVQTRAKYFFIVPYSFLAQQSLSASVGGTTGGEEPLWMDRANSTLECLGCTIFSSGSH